MALAGSGTIGVIEEGIENGFKHAFEHVLNKIFLLKFGSWHSLKQKKRLRFYAHGSILISLAVIIDLN